MMSKSKTIKLDCLKGKNPIKGKPFEWEHAKKIMQLQKKNGHNDWTVSPDENLKFENGDFESNKTTKNS